MMDLNQRMAPQDRCEFGRKVRGGNFARDLKRATPMRCIPIPGVRLLMVVGAFVASTVTASLAEAAEGRCLIAVKGHTYR